MFIVTFTPRGAIGCMEKVALFVSGGELEMCSGFPAVNGSIVATVNLNRAH